MTELDLQLKNEFENLPENFWDFKQANTRDLTHGLHYYPATMVYPISRNILKIIQNHTKINSLMDPFMGSGTVIVEGMLGNIHNLYGTDLNPLAVLMSRVKTTKLNENQLNFISNDHKNLLKSISYQTNQIADEFDDYIQKDLKLDITAKTGWGNSADKYIKIYSDKKGKSFMIGEFQVFT